MEHLGGLLAFAHLPDTASQRCRHEHGVVAINAMSSRFAFCPSGACVVYLYHTDALQALGCVHPGSSATARPAGLKLSGMIWVLQG